MLARDIMAHPVVTVLATEDLETAARRMLDHRIGCLPVVGDDGRLVGILTESDYQAAPGQFSFSMFEMPKLFGRWVDLDGMNRIYNEARSVPVATVMSRNPASLPEDAPIEKVASLMLQRQCHHIPIVRDDRPVGIIARRDLLRVIAQR